MAMIDMARPVEGEEGTMLGSTPAIGYPEGLEIELEDADLARLGLGPLSLGTVVTMTVRAVVTSTEQEAEVGAPGVSTCTELQITGIDLGGTPGGMAGRMYGA
jgi:hypothetical protein